jgi:hypothetical protein
VQGAGAASSAHTANEQVEGLSVSHTQSPGALGLPNGPLTVTYFHQKKEGKYEKVKLHDGHLPSRAALIGWR